MRAIDWKRDFALRAVKLAIGASWVVVILYVVIHSIPNNALLPSAQRRNRLRLVMPEGWAFFTRDAQEPDLYVYRQLEDGTVSLEGREDRSFPLAGADRRVRIRRGAVASLADVIGPDHWSDCRGDVAACARASKTAPARPPRPPFLDACGSILLERRKPAPWMWYRRNTEFRMPSQIAKVVIPC